MRNKQYSREQVQEMIAQERALQEKEIKQGTWAQQQRAEQMEDIERLPLLMMDLGELAGCINVHAPLEMAEALVRIAARSQAWLEAIPYFD